MQHEESSMQLMLTLCGVIIAIIHSLKSKFLCCAWHFISLSLLSLHFQAETAMAIFTTENGRENTLEIYEIAFHGI